MSRFDRCAIIVKAQPHRSSRYSETVCCAGIGADGWWRRQYPVPFRILNDGQKFRRWSWIEYSFSAPKEDRRRESQKVVPESIKVVGEMKPAERARLLNPLVRESFDEADSRNESLTLLRPQSLRWTAHRKDDRELEDERRKHAALASQLSLLDSTAVPLDPCPYQFVCHWKDVAGTVRRHECDDWESAGAFFRFRRNYGEQEALTTLREKYENAYFNAGLALAFSTHSRRNATYGTRNQWLLVGLIRLDESPQGDLFLGR